MDALAPADATDFAALGQDVAEELANDDGATVGTIDGAVRGGGLDLALACDVRLCSEASAFAATGVAVGLLGAWAGPSDCPQPSVPAGPRTSRSPGA